MVYIIILLNYHIAFHNLFNNFPIIRHFKLCTAFHWYKPCFNDLTYTFILVHSSECIWGQLPRNRIVESKVVYLHVYFFFWKGNCQVTSLLRKINKQIITISSPTNSIQKKMWKVCNTHFSKQLKCYSWYQNFLVADKPSGAWFWQVFSELPLLTLARRAATVHGQLSSHSPVFFTIPIFPYCNLSTHMLAPRLGDNLFWGTNQALGTFVFLTPVMVSDTRLSEWQEGWEAGKGERDEEIQRKEGRGKDSPLVPWLYCEGPKPTEIW